jgi:hypothetical protein
MWNPFKKNSQQNNDKDNTDPKDDAVKTDDVKKADDSPKMNMLQRLAMKKMERMSPQEKAKMMQEVLKPENKDKLLGAMEMMRKSGQISEEQYRMAKEKMGI